MNHELMTTERRNFVLDGGGWPRPTEAPHREM